MERPPRTGGDAALARFGLLPEGSLPARPSAASNVRNRARCGPRVIFRRLATGAATSPRYDIEGGRVQQSVLLFRDPAVAARAFDELTAAANQRCLEQYMRSAVSEEARSSVGPAEEQTITVEPRGDQATAYRVVIAVYSSGATGAIDVLINRIGRSLSSTSVIWTQRPRDLEFDEAFVLRSVARMQAALA